MMHHGGIIEKFHLGWKPKDNANVFCNKIDTDLDKSSKNRLSAIYQGGLFCDDVIHEEYYLKYVKSFYS